MSTPENEKKPGGGMSVREAGQKVKALIEQGKRAAADAAAAADKRAS